MSGTISTRHEGARPWVSRGGIIMFMVGIVFTVEVFDVGWTFGEWGSGANSWCLGEPVGVGYEVDCGGAA
ncbi:hypothetical protein Tco_0585944 [Tanacetum coccineum]